MSDDPTIERIPGLNFGWFAIEHNDETSILFTIELKTIRADQKAMTYIEVTDVKEIIKIRSFLDSFILDRLSELTRSSGILSAATSEPKPGGKLRPEDAPGKTQEPAKVYEFKLKKPEKEGLDS